MEKANAIEEYFIDALSKAIEKKDEAELQFVIAQKEYDEVLEAYKQYTKKQKQDELINKYITVCEEGDEVALDFDTTAIIDVFTRNGVEL